jgi:hypothetical protein
MQMQRHLPPVKHKRFQETTPPAGLEAITSSKHPEIIRQPARPLVFQLRPRRLAPRHRPRAAWRPHRRPTLRAAVAAIAAAASLPPPGVARRAGPRLLPRLRRTPLLLLPAGARTEALASCPEKKNGSALRSRFSFATSRALEPQVSRDSVKLKVVFSLQDVVEHSPASAYARLSVMERLPCKAEARREVGFVREVGADNSQGFARQQRR